MRPLRHTYLGWVEKHLRFFLGIPKICSRSRVVPRKKKRELNKIIMPTTDWGSKYRTLLREVERLRREIDVLRGVVREYASEKVDWCTSCDMVVSCRPTCIQCGTSMIGICSDCATESSVHDLDSARGDV